jgi:hypothetical protein
MLVGCYSIDVYCTNSTESSGGESLFVCSAITPGDRSGGFAQATGQTERECVGQVQARGWKISKRDDRQFCPKCVKDKKVW